MVGYSSTTAAATREHSPFFSSFSLLFSLSLYLSFLRFLFYLFFFPFIILVETVGHVQSTRQEPKARCWNQDIAPFFDAPLPGPYSRFFSSFFVPPFPIFFSFHPIAYT
jgi:hypothetical protein